MTTSRPWRTPSAESASTCSADCGIQPSSAATTSSTAGTGPTPASMVVTNRSWPGTSTKATSAPGASVVQANPRSMVMPRRRSSAHRSGSIPVSARTSVDLPWSTWPAVATTCIERRLHATAVAEVAVGRQRAQVEQAAARSSRPSTGGTAGAQRAGERLGQGDGGAGQRDAGRRRPPTVAVRGDRLGVDPAAAQPVGQPGRARACSAAGSASRRRRVGVPGPRRVASNAARVSLSTRIARASGCRRSRANSSAAPGAPSSSPACGPPSSLSPDAVTSVAPGPQRRRRVGLVGQQRVRGEQARPDVGDDRHAERRQLVDGDRRGEAGDDEVRRVHLEHEAGVRADGRRVVGAGATRLVVPTSRSRAPVGGEQVGDAEPVADLDQLAAAMTISRPPASRASAVATRASAAAPLLTRCAAAAAGTAASSASTAPRPRGPRAGGEVELDVAGPGGDVERGPGGGGERRAAEVGVQQDAGGVEHRAQAGGGGGQRVEHGVDDGLGRDLAAAHAVLRGGDGGLDQRAAQPRDGQRDLGLGQHGVGAGHPAPGSDARVTRRGTARGAGPRVAGRERAKRRQRSLEFG